MYILCTLYWDQLFRSFDNTAVFGTDRHISHITLGDLKQSLGWVIAHLWQYAIATVMSWCQVTLLGVVMWTSLSDYSTLIITYLNSKITVEITVEQQNYFLIFITNGHNHQVLLPTVQVPTTRQVKLDQKNSYVSFWASDLFLGALYSLKPINSEIAHIYNKWISSLAIPIAQWYTLQ